MQMNALCTEMDLCQFIVRLDSRFTRATDRDAGIACELLCGSSCDDSMVAAEGAGSAGEGGEVPLAFAESPNTWRCLQEVEPYLKRL